MDGDGDKPRAYHSTIKLTTLMSDKLAQLLSIFAGEARGLGFDSWAGQIEAVSPTTRHRCDVFSELCSSGTRLRRAPPLVAHLYAVVLKLVEVSNPISVIGMQQTLSNNQLWIQKILVEGMQFLIRLNVH